MGIVQSKKTRKAGFIEEETGVLGILINERDGWETLRSIYICSDI